MFSGISPESVMWLNQPWKRSSAMLLTVQYAVECGAQIRIGPVGSVFPFNMLHGPAGEADAFAYEVVEPWLNGMSYTAPSLAMCTCRCGPVELPLLPARPRYWPAVMCTPLVTAASGAIQPLELGV